MQEGKEQARRDGNAAMADIIDRRRDSFRASVGSILPEVPSLFAEFGKSTEVGRNAESADLLRNR